jgi:sugar/nucleoside kinase (ribokinase family)
LGIKLGPEGCILRTPGGAERIAAYGVDVSDGSGAGDAFMAGFLYATLQGQPPEAAARFGNATAAHCIQSIGCSAGVPPAEEVERFIERRKA